MKDYIKKTKVSSNCSVISPLYIFSIIFLTITSLMIFGSKGAFISILIASVVVIVYLSGIRVDRRNLFVPTIYWKESRWLWFIIFHSHHSRELCERGREFKIRNKFFCTGCYGSSAGIIISMMATGYYLANGISQILASLLAMSIPIWFLPIILRYTIFINMKSPVRFLSNMFLPIGCFSSLIVLDYFFENLIVNGSVVLFILIIFYLRIKASKTEKV